MPDFFSPSLEKATANCHRKSERMRARFLGCTLQMSFSLEESEFPALTSPLWSGALWDSPTPLWVLSLCGLPTCVTVQRPVAGLLPARGRAARSRCPFLGVPCCGLGSRRGAGLGLGRPPAPPFAPSWGLSPGLQDVSPAWPPPPPLPLVAPKPRTRPCSFL